MLGSQTSKILVSSRTKILDGLRRKHEYLHKPDFLNGQIQALVFVISGKRFPGTCIEPIAQVPLELIAQLGSTLRRFVTRRTSRLLEHMTTEEVREMLEMHLLWQNNVHDDFVSWTSSLLFALQRDIYAVQTRDKAIDVSICILDTWKMDTETFYPAETLLGLYSVRNAGKLLHCYYTAEFPSIGTLNLSPGHDSDVVSFSKMEDSVLYDLVWHLRPGYDQLQFPSKIFRLQDVMCPSLVLPFFTNLLSLQKRDAEDELFKAGGKALIEQGAGSAFMREDPALGNAVDEDVIEFAKMWKAGQESEVPVGKDLSEMLRNLSIGGTWNLNDEEHFEDPDYNPTYSIWDDHFKGYGDNESDTDEVEESNMFDDFLYAYN